MTLWRVISVEDWAEMRQSHRAEAMPIKTIAWRLGTSRNAVRRSFGPGGPAAVPAAGEGVVPGRVRADDPGAAAGVPADAGDGDRPKCRVKAVADGVEGPSARAAAGAPAAGPGPPARRTWPRTGSAGSLGAGCTSAAGAPGGQVHRRMRQRLPGDLRPARAHFRLPGRLESPSCGRGSPRQPADRVRRGVRRPCRRVHATA